MLRAPQHISELLPSLSWHVTRSYRFSQTSHVNLQEMRAVKAELVEQCNTSLIGEVSCNIIDSKVLEGAWAAGRSSSYQLNGLLRQRQGWEVLGQVFEGWRSVGLAS